IIGLNFRTKVLKCNVFDVPATYRSQRGAYPRGAERPMQKSVSICVICGKKVHPRGAERPMKKSVLICVICGKKVHPLARKHLCEKRHTTKPKTSLHSQVSDSVMLRTHVLINPKLHILLPSLLYYMSSNDYICEN
ncbi:MAG: hypothetical protein RR254_09195, partial [Muribaculaceae bacterium]